MALCKELGLDEDESLAPVPKRRKANSRGIALEEKISSAEPKSLDENRRCKDATEKLNSSTLPKQEYLSTKSSRSSLEDTLGDGRDVTFKNNCGHFMDRKPTLHRPGSSDNLSSLAEKRSQGSVGEDLPGNRTDFNVPPSPGHIQPLPDKLSQIHHLLQKGEPLPKVLKF